MNLTEETAKELNRHLRWYKTIISKQAEYWVKISVIKSKTIWQTKEQMRSARDNGYVKVSRDKEGIWYNLLSVDKQFLKK